ncbi:MAG: regulatory protein RecX [Lachnospiraceae bacterium]|nr:regulatory protein RecX [Lachnospiraceae bacterium]
MSSTVDKAAAAELLRKQIREIETADRAGDGIESRSCPSSIPAIWKPAVNKAMNLLLYRPRTEKELRDRLSGCGYEPNAVDFALNYVSYYGYLNDTRYAEGYVLSRGSGKSRSALRRELSVKGVDEASIEAAMELLETDERTIVEELLRKRYGMPHRMDERELRRAAGYLGRKGFAVSLVWGALREYQNSADSEPDELE